MARKTPKMSIAIHHDATTGTSDAISPNWGVHQGTVIMAKIIIPNYVNSARTNIYLVDSEGDDIYAFLDLVMNTTHIVTDLQIPLIYGETLRAETNGNPGGAGDWNVYVTLYYVSDFKTG